MGSFRCVRIPEFPRVKKKELNAMKEKAIDLENGMKTKGHNQLLTLVARSNQSNINKYTFTRVASGYHWPTVCFCTKK